MKQPDSRYGQRVRVLFVCTGNSARSQMAEAWLRHLGGDAFDAHSAGSEPKGLHPLTVAVMREAGVDVSSAQSKGLERYLDQSWDFVITVCDAAAETCPAFPGPARRLHWSVPDPAAAAGGDEARLDAFRSARDVLRTRVEDFVSSVAGEHAGSGRPA